MRDWTFDSLSLQSQDGGNSQHACQCDESQHPKWQEKERREDAAVARHFKQRKNRHGSRQQCSR